MLALHDLAVHAPTPVCYGRRWPQGLAALNGVCVLCATPACQSSVSCHLARRVRCFGKGGAGVRVHRHLSQHAWWAPRLAAQPAARHVGRAAR
jgi:hypothetical protein